MALLGQLTELILYLETCIFIILFTIPANCGTSGFTVPSVGLLPRNEFYPYGSDLFDSCYIFCLYQNGVWVIVVHLLSKLQFNLDANPDVLDLSLLKRK